MRIPAIALALPLLFGVACKTSSTQGSSTASTDQQGKSAPASAGANDAKGHPDDKVVSGVITGVSSQALTILSTDGSNKTLQLVHETSVRVDGQNASNADLQEGQPVRASFNSVGGADVAVDVRAGKGVGDTTQDTGVK